MSGIDWMPHCHYCGRYVNPSKSGTAWSASGEFGEETDYFCIRCVSLPNFRLIAGNGTTDPRWCGIVKEAAEQ